MKSGDYWSLFLETGAPECYVAFQAAKRQEDENVSENTGTCTPANAIQ